MTAEIAVYNRAAIALAADSASTVTNGRSSKVYNTAEKLFPLTKNYPVALMIYGSGELAGIPWEVLIKAYRRHLGDTSYPSMDEYVSSFFSFLTDFYPKLSRVDEEPECQLLEFMVKALDFIMEETYPDCPSPTDIESTLTKVIPNLDTAIEALREFPSLKTFDGEFSDFSIEENTAIKEHIVSEMEFFCSELDININFDDKLSPTYQFYEKFSELISIALVKPAPFEPPSTGLVFAGYGEDEYLPVMKTVEISGYFQNNFRLFLPKEKSIKDGVIGLAPFAQESEVEIFMEGISDTLKQTFYESLTNMAALAINELECSDLIPEENKKQITENLFNKLKSQFVDDKRYIEEFIEDQHVNKIVEMIQHLPKNELAYMAESLVNLTAFKRKVTNSIDTVGGPIDVAVISKGEGLVWVKRKHYFPGNLNRSYPTQP